MEGCSDRIPYPASQVPCCWPGPFVNAGFERHAKWQEFARSGLIGHISIQYLLDEHEELSRMQRVWMSRSDH